MLQQLVISLVSLPSAFSIASCGPLSPVPATAWERTYMIFKYEMACREAGMTDERIREIYNLFNADYQRLFRRKKAKERSKLDFLAVEGMRGPDGEFGTFEIPDESVDIEEEIIHKLELERLREVLAMLTEEDRRFILEYFEGEGRFLDELAARYGLTRNQAIGKKKAIIRLLKELY